MMESAYETNDLSKLIVTSKSVHHSEFISKIETVDKRAQNIKSGEKKSNRVRDYF